MLMGFARYVWLSRFSLIVKKNDLKSKNAVDADSGIWSKGRPAAEQQTHSDI
jgi:hypothetical protein